MKKILYVFLLLTVFGFIQPTTVMAGQPPSDHQIACSYLEYEVCVTTPGCYIYYYYDEDNKRVAECRQCPADFYCGGGYSLPCPDDTSSPPQSESEEDCKVPETCAEIYSETMCVSKNLGCEWSSSDNKCVKCPRGYYCDSTPPYKHACSTGYTTSDEGARTKDECKIDCEEYKTNENWCTTAAGCYYDDVAGGCKDCTANYYCSPQKKEKTPCPLGATSDTGAKGITDCYFSEITIKENKERTYTINPGNKLYFFSTGNNIIIQPQFEILEACFPNFPCDPK